MYHFKFHPEAKQELKDLNKSIQILFTKKLKQILNSPELAIKLDNKNNLNLTGLRKVYFNTKKHRIVYSIIEDKIIIYIINSSRINYPQKNVLLKSFLTLYLQKKLKK